MPHVFIHSTCTHDINAAKAIDKWATTQSHTPILNAHFDSGEDVYLFFTVYRSYKYTGVAIMRSLCNGPRSDAWLDPPRYGKTCAIEWVVKKMSHPFTHRSKLDMDPIPEDEAAGVLKAVLRLAVPDAECVADPTARALVGLPASLRKRRASSCQHERAVRQRVDDDCASASVPDEASSSPDEDDTERHCS